MQQKLKTLFLKIKEKLFYLNWIWNYVEKEFYPITSARYLGVIIDENVNWKKHLNDTSHKLIQGNVILCKIRNYVNKATLRTLFCNFHSYINYVPIAPGNTNHVQQRISLLQRKALRIMHFVQFDSDTSALFYNSKLLTFFDVIYSENFIFTNNCFNKDSFAVFAQNYNLCSIPILAIPDPQVKVSFLFQHAIQ